MTGISGRKGQSEELLRRTVRDRVNWLWAMQRRAGNRRFSQRLEEETRRSQRYGHAFSVLLLGAELFPEREFYERVRPQMRCTDIVEVIEPPTKTGPREPSKGTGSQRRAYRIAAILPETDRNAARTALSRLRSGLSEVKGFTCGVAAYPADATHPQQLLELAEGAAV